MAGRQRVPPLGAGGRVLIPPEVRAQELIDLASPGVEPPSPLDFHAFPPLSAPAPKGRRPQPPRPAPRTLRTFVCGTAKPGFSGERAGAMNVLSLFDGISCGRVALERAGVPVGQYFACEIDHHATEVSKSNYPDIIHLGDVKKVKAKDLPEIDIILAGSPCQGFSQNGQHRGFEDPRSQLFWEFVRLVIDCKPTWFLLENVKMKKEWEAIITKTVGYEPVVINSALVSAQRRVRNYWTNIPFMGQPDDRRLVLRDILEEGAGAAAGADRGEEPKVLVSGKAKDDDYNGQGNRVYHPDGKVGTLTTGAPKVQTGGDASGTGSPHKNKPVIAPEHWRMLTPVECERLQTLPDNYTAAVSKTQRYKQLGNGWTVDVITHLLSPLALLEEPEEAEPEAPSTPARSAPAPIVAVPSMEELTAENPMLLKGNCLELLKKLPPKSVDLFVCDLPYGETNCSWDSVIDLKEFWQEFKRVRRSKRTACIHFCSTKFGFTLIKSWEKGFKMDMVWKKRNKTGGLQSRYRPMRNHEMVYFFYEHAPKYNRDKYHKRIAQSVASTPERGEGETEQDAQRRIGTKCGSSEKEHIYSPEQIKRYREEHGKFDVPTPASVVEEADGADAAAAAAPAPDSVYAGAFGGDGFGYDGEEHGFEPRLPVSMFESGSSPGRKRHHQTEKPQDILVFFLKYWSDPGDVILDPTMGSGSTGVACKRMGRKFIGMELTERYFAVAQQRISDQEREAEEPQVV